MIVTLFKNIRETSTPYHLDIGDVLKRIQRGDSKDKIVAIRNEKDKQKRQELKKNLPSICFSGTFRERAAKKIIKHSGIICLDFDDFQNIDQLIDFRTSFIQDKFVYCCFISPSGRGLKVLVKIPSEKHNHKKYFEALKEYFDTKHFDISGSDVSRVCYESYDPDIFINEDSEVFNEILDTKEYHYHDTTNVKVKLKSPSEIIERLDKWWVKNFGKVKGQRNSNIFKLACAFSEFGIDKYICENHLYKFEEKDFTKTEIQRTIESAYKKTKETFDTKYFEDNKIVDYVNRQFISGVSENEIKQELLRRDYDEDDVELVLEEAKENEGIEIFWLVSARGRVTIISKKLKDYLRQKGYYKYYPEGSQSYVFVKVEANLIDFTTEDVIKTFILNELEKNNQFDVYEYLAVNTRYFKEDYLNILDTINVSMKRDTRETAYCYYRNCVVEVTKDNIKTIDYINLDGYVWKDRVIDRDFSIVQDHTNDYQQFIKNIASKNDKNVLAFETTIGYLMHGFKNKGFSPAVILNDEVISENPEGGTGKGIIVDGIKSLKKVVILDGKSFDKNKSFAYQIVTTSTQVLVFDDVKKKFDFEGLFSLITEGITLEKKNKDAIKLDFYQSPKILITTNYAINGSGNSHERRKWELELAQHYNVKHTPYDEFGKMLLDDFDQDEWLRFDNYMVSNLQKFLKMNFANPELKNLKTRKFITSTSFEFHEWAEDKENTAIKKARVSKSELFDDFVEEYTDYKKWLRKKTFQSWLKQYAKYKDISYEEGNTNGTRWCDFGFKLTQQEQEKIDKEIDEIPF